jgi:serine protease Do
VRRMGLLSVTIVAQLLSLGLAEPVLARRESTSSRQTPVTRVYQDTHKAVVNIVGERIMSASRGPGYQWPGMSEFWGPRFQRQVVVLGSGMVVHEDGYVITNAHVIQGTKKIKVIFSDGREFSAEIISADESRDLAILKIPAENKLPFIHFGRSYDLMIGETVIAIGNPYGYSSTVTSGIVTTR